MRYKVCTVLTKLNRNDLTPVKKMITKVLILLLLTLCVQFIDTDFFGLSGPPNFIYREFSHCLKEPTTISLNITPRWINKTHQVLDGNLSTPIPIGDNLFAKVAAYMLVENRWIHLANITCKFCQLLQNYLGPARKTTLGCLGLSENTCPIPKGTYRPRNAYLHMRDSRIPTFPYGLLKIIFALHSVTTDAIELCLQILMENKPIQGASL